MKLTELNPEFIRWEDRIEPSKKVAPGFATSAAWHAAGCPTIEVIGPVTYMPVVATLTEAQGVEFDCPKCSNGHRVAVAFIGREVSDHHGSRAKDGRPTRWQVSGSGLDDLSLSPSVDCTGSDPNCWHGYIKNGLIV